MTAVAEWKWTSASGSTRVLTNPATGAYLGVGGVVGHHAAPVTHLAATPPTLDGGVYRSRKVEPRDLALRVHVGAATAQGWNDTVRDLVNDFDTTDGPGVLCVAQPDGSRRYLDCRYLSGFESPDGGDPGAVPHAVYTVLLRAYDPWWYGVTETKKFEVQTTQTLFGDGSGAPPFYIMPTELIGSGSTIINPGDVEAYPVWTINGPMTACTVALSGGGSFTITDTLGAGEWVQVDTNPSTPAFEKIVDDAGTNLWGTATSNYPNLWALPAGTSTVTVSLTGSTSSSSVQMAYFPRYRSA